MLPKPNRTNNLGNISNEIEVIYKINSIIPIISKNVGNKSKTYISKNTLWLEIFKMFLNEKHEIKTSL